MKGYELHLWDEFRSGRLNRRELLRLASVAGVSLAAFGVTGTRSAMAQTEPKRGGTLRLAAQYPGKDPESVTASNAGEVFTYQPSLEYLCYPREDWTLDPRLATSWKADPDPKTWVFTIRQGVKWHDGSTLTTDDVVATFERLLDPKVGSSAGSIYKGVLSFGNVEKVSDADVRFHLDKPFVDFPYLVSGFAYQSAILPKNYEMGSFTKGGIGTGPFVLKEYVPHQHADYVANKEYWAKGMPYLDGLKVLYFAEESATVLAMQAGDVDIYPVVPLKGGEPILSNPKFKILRHASADYRSIHMRVDQAPFKDKRVRQAVAYCIDRGSAREVAVQRCREPSPTITASRPSMSTRNSPTREIPQRKQDYEKAKACSRRPVSTASTSLSPPANIWRCRNMPWRSGNTASRPASTSTSMSCPSINIMGRATISPGSWCRWARRIGRRAERWLRPSSPSSRPARFGTRRIGAIRNSTSSSPITTPSSTIKSVSKLALELAKIEHEELPVIISYWIEAQRATTKAVNGFPTAPDNFVDLRATWLSS